MNPAVKIIIFNTERGFCGFVKGPNGHSLLIDCGKKDGFSPVNYILQNELNDAVSHDGHLLTELIISHPHDDHIEDIEDLISKLSPAILRRNYYNWESLKVGDKERYKNLDIYSDWQNIYKFPITNEPNWGIEIIDDFNLSLQESLKLNENNFVNNSSIPVIINFKGTNFNEKILFGGDLMKEGWLELLKNPNFKNHLKGVDFFITSHHGHTSGYCKEVFDAMGRTPIVNIVSEKSGDENVDPAYSSLAIGETLNGEKRFQLSTRTDGDIIIEIDQEGRYEIRTENFDDNIKIPQRFPRYF